MMNLIKVILSICIYLTAACDGMARTQTFSFTTRDYVQGDSALTTLYVHNGTYKLVMRGDAADTRMPGAGIFEGTLSDEQERELAVAYEEAKKYQPFTPSPIIDGFLTAFYKHGDPIVKLDVTINMKPENAALLVAVTFKNTGRQEMCLRSPATWEGRYNPIAGNSWIAVSAKSEKYDTRKSEEGLIRTGFFGGAQMVNADEFPDDRMCIPSMQAKVAKFRVFPQSKIKKGKYLIGASIAVREVLSPAEFAGALEMNSVNQVIELGRDYPSTPEEINAYSTYLQSKDN
ncbi:hypothetical protein [Caballeronia grimmiae]|uniref:hypothetical protein n=1 Tax=Caballeronia grimmiae TaxID=1071679 RepID=UPI0038B8B4D4